MGAVRNVGLTSIRLAGALLLVIVLSAGLIAPDRVAAANTFAPGDPVVTTDTVNVRTRADTSADIRAVASAGQPFTVGLIRARTADGFTWYRVSTATRVNYGWIASDFLEIDLPVEEGDCAVVTDGPLNLRSAAGTSRSVVTVLADGTDLTVLTEAPVRVDGFLWHRVTDQEAEGWVATQFIEVSFECGSTDQPVIQVGQPIRVFDGPLNAREDADLSADIDFVLADEAVATVTDGPVDADGFVWWEVETAGGSTGWVVDDFVVADGDLTGELIDLGQGDTFTVNTDALNVRSTAGLDGDIIDVAAFGATGTRVVGTLQTVDDLDWIRVSIPNVGTGWVVLGFVTES